MDTSNQEIVLLERVRVSYLYAFHPFIGKDDAGKDSKTYCVHALFDRGDANHVKVSAAIQKVVQAWGVNAQAVLTQMKAQDKLCLHEGNISKMGKEEYKDKLYVSANGSRKPTVVVSRGGVNVEIGPDDPYAPYSGCWANVQFAIYPQNPPGKPNKWGNRVNAQFMGIQFLEHGEAFGGGGAIAKPEEFPVQETAGADAPPPSAAGAANGLI